MRTRALTIAMLLTISAAGQTREQVMAELKRQGIPHPEIVLAQARHETGNFTSRLCRVQHNLFGIKHNGKYATYRNWKESVADYKRCISSRYRNGENYYSFLVRINYAADKKYVARIKHIVETSK